MKKYFKCICAAAIASSMILGMSAIAMAAEIRTITAKGEGIVRVEPDVCYVSIRAASLEKTAQKAKASNDKKVEDIVKALKGAGLSDENIISDSFSVHPKYNWENGYEEIVGYEAYQYIEAEVKDLSKAGEIADLAIEKGGNVNGLTYSVLDKEEAYVEALGLAVKNAGIKAAGIGKALGVSVLGPVSVVEGDVYNGFISYKDFVTTEESAASTRGMNSTYLSYSDIEVLANVTIVYEY